MRLCAPPFSTVATSSPRRRFQPPSTNNSVRQLAGKYRHATNLLYLGRQFNFPTALEGALKLKEIKARGGPVIAITAEGDKDVGRLADDVIFVPRVEEFLSPLINIIPLQLLAYHIAIL